MNANCYRIIFNRARGLFMAVAEIASACGKSSGETRPGTTPAALAPAFTLAHLRPAAFAALLALGAQLTIVPLATAQIVAYKAAPASQRPTVLSAGNGVPLINIQSPSAAGVSRNTYSQFDVDQNGVILNNARNNALTQLGGWVQGNPWLARGSARVILNEVVSANPSQLRGYVEVAGSSAQVVIANPAGIACDGCGFINASRSTLTTGTPIVNGGNLESYRVEGGTIRIDGAGLDASRVAYTDLIARAVEVNAGLWAQTLKVSTGANVVDAGHSSATPIAGSGAAPAFSIDVASLGGMYAGKITLVGTEAGVGVRNAGWIGASAGEVVVTADGRLQNSGSIVAAGNIGIDARAGITNTGTAYAQSDLGFATASDIQNSGGLVAAGGNATLAASGAGSRISGDAAAVFAAGLNADGSLAATGKLTLTANEQISARGQQVAGGDLAISARSLDLADSRNSAQNISLTASAGDLDLTRANSVASGTLSALSTQALHHDDARSNAGQLDLAAHSLGNARGELIQTGGGDTTIALAGDLDNTAGRIAANSLNLSLSAQAIDNTDGSIEHAGAGDLGITADTLTGTRGSIVSNGALALTAQSATLDAARTAALQITIKTQTLSNRSGEIMQSGPGEIAITASSRFDNNGGKLGTGGALNLAAPAIDNTLGLIAADGGVTLGTSALNNDRGRIESAAGNIVIDSTGAVANAGGRMVTALDATLRAATLDNGDGQISARDIHIELGERLDNAGPGRLLAQRDLTLAAGSLNNDGELRSGQNLDILTRAGMNNSGAIHAGRDLTANIGAALQNTGWLAAQGDATLLARQIGSSAGAFFGAGVHTDGTLTTNGKLQLTSTEQAALHGQNVAGQRLEITAAAIDLGDSRAAAQDIALTASAGDIAAHRAAIVASRSLQVATPHALRTDDAKLSAPALTIAAHALSNTKGEIVQTGEGDLRIDLPGELDNTGGRIVANGRNAALAAHTVSNVDGRIEHAGAGSMSIEATTLAGQRGQIAGNGVVHLKAGIATLDGASTRARQIDIDATSLFNRGGEIIHTGSSAATIKATTLLDNSGGMITGNGDMTLTLGGLINAGGQLGAGGNAEITALEIGNATGRMTAGQTLRVSATETIDNNAGAIVGNDSVVVRGTALGNDLGTLGSAHGAVQILTVGVISNRQGRIQSAQNMSIAAGSLDNHDGRIAGHDLAVVTAGDLRNTGSALLAAQNNLTLASHGLSNDGTLQAGGDLQANAGAALDNTGTIYARGNTGLASQGDLRSSGLIAAGNNTTLTATGADSRISASASAVFAAGLLPDGALADSGRLSLTAGHSINLHGRSLSGGDQDYRSTYLDLAGSRIDAGNLDLDAGAGALDANGATLIVRQTLRATTAATLRTDNAQVFANQLELSARNLSNIAGEIVQTGNGNTAIDLSENLDNSGGRIAVNSHDLSLSAASIGNVGSRIEHAGAGAFAIRTSRLDGSDGLLQSNNQISLAAGAVTLDRASLVARQIDIDVASLFNRGGEIIHTGNDHFAITARTVLDNSGGTIAGNGATTLTVGDLLNRGGSVQAAGSAALNIDASGTLDNAAGQLDGGGSVDLAAREIGNAAGRISAGQALRATALQTIDNAGGLIAAKDNVALAAARLDNAGGTLGSVAGSLAASVGGAIDNRAGRIEAAQNIALASNGLNNSDGTIAGNALSIDSRGLQLDNSRGILVAGNTMNLQTGALTNHAGLIQAADALVIDTHGQRLANTGAGSIIGQRSIRIASGDLDNASGLIGAKGHLGITGTALANTAGGRINGEADIALTASRLDNRGGQVQALGAIDVRAGDRIDNSSGLLRAGRTLTLDTATLNNADTLAADQGIEGHAVTLSANNIDNRNGALRADTALVIESSGTLDNRAGLISSAQTLTVRDPGASKTLAITNTAGTVIAGTRLDIDSASLSGDGKLLSLGDLRVKLVADYTHSGAFAEITADGRAIVETAGTLSNRAKLQAGTALALTAATIDNQSAGQILAPALTLSATDTHTLTNRGLIDGGDTRIDAVTLNNLGSGRIYGDHLAIAATTLNNAAEAGSAPVIAARDRLDLAVGTLNNREGALLFSVGDLAIGGSLDADKRATGTAGTINNASATIEALASLSLNATLINNSNEHFSTTLVTVGSVGVDEYIYGGRYRPDQVSLTWTKSGRVYYPPATNGMSYMSGQGFFSDNSNNYVYLNSPSGSTRNFWLYSYTRTTQETQVLTSDPGRITAGGELLLTADTLNNSNSQIVAGGNLRATLGTLNNTATAGERIVRDSGTAWYVFRDKEHKDSDRDAYGYNPAPTVTGFTLSASRLEGNTAPGGSGTRLTALSVGGVGGSVGGASSASTAIGSAAPTTPSDLRIADIDGASRSALAPNTSTIGALDAALLLRSSDPATPVSPVTTASADEVRRATPAVADSTVHAVAAGPGSAVPRITRVDIPGAAGGAGSIVATMHPTSTLPTSSLYRTHPDTGQPLIETDPRFAGYRQWLTSDYMLTQLALNPSTTQKRLGDGFYEQRLINEQVAQLTGRRFLAGFANEEEQYRALMNAGITYAKTWQLIPGVALTADQMAQLTSDMVWLVEQDVNLADGSTQKVLAPQLYARTREGDLAPSGALLADKALELNVAGNLNNLGTLAGRQLVSLSAENIRNLGGRVTGEEVFLTARGDIDNLGGTMDAGSRLDLFAERNIRVESTTRSDGGRTNIDRIASLYVNNPGGSASASPWGTLQLEANGDIGLLAAYLINNAPTAAGVPGGVTRIDAGNNLTLGTVSTAYAEEVGDGKHARQESGSSEVGSVIQSAGDLTLIAGRDLTARAAGVTSDQGRLLASAGQDLRIEAGESTLNTAEQHKYKSKGFLSSSKTTTRDTLNETNAIASTFSADSTTLIADRDIAIRGSNVVATNDATLIATRDITIEAASETHSETHFSKTKQSGVFSSGGVGFTIGSRMNSSDQTTDATLAAKSTVGSTDGNVTLLAGENYRQVGSDVIAGKGDIDIAAKTVDIVEARQTSRTVTETKSKQSGFTLAFTSPVISAIQTAQQMSAAAKDTKDGRMQLLAAANVGLAANNAADAVIAGQGKTVEIKNPDGSTTLKDNQLPVLNDKGEVTGTRDATAADKMGGVGINLSLGSSKSSSKSTQTSDTAAVSNLTAGRDIRIEARGGGEQSDITLQGTKATAARNLTLAADDEIKLLAARNTFDQHSSNKNSSASVGIGFMVGGTQNGFTIQAGVSGGKGKADGADLNWSNTRAEAGETLTLQSGGNTTLKGAVAKGDKLVADIKGDLAIESLQDTSTYDSKQKSLGVSVSLCIPPFCYGAASTGSVSASGSKVKSDFASITEQSGFRAGDGGFQVTVMGDTDLKGGAITSTQQAIDDGLNRFTTDGELTISNIQNKAEYSAKSASVNVGTGFSASGKLTPGGTSAGFGKDSGKAENTTLAAISGVAGNKEARTGDKETGIAKIFDQAKVQKEIDAQVKITQMFGQLAPKAAADFAKTRYDDLLAQAKLENDPAKKTELVREAKLWDEGGAYRIALHTAIGGLAGGTSGALGAGATAAAAPLLNELQDNIAKGLKEAGASDGIAKVAGQLIASTTAAGIGAAAGGAGGAMTAFNVDANNRQLHPREIDLIKARAKDFAARMSKEGEPMTEAQAIKMLAENAADQVDNLDQRTPNGGSAYVNAQAKQFLQQISLEAGSFTDTRGLQIKYFTTETASGQQLNLDFSNTALYSEAYNSKAYQDFAYANLNRNLLGDKPTPEALRTYINRETDQNKRAMAAAMLLAGSGGAALAVKIAPRILAAGKAFVEACAANPVACMNQLGLTAADLALGDAVPAGMGLATANVLTNKLFDKAKPGEIEQIAARLAKYTPDELLAINGATQFKDGSRNSAESVNALLEMTNGAISPYMPGTQVRDAIVGVGQKLYIVENTSAQGPGGWAAAKIYTDLNEARREMALLPEWKNTFSEEGKINDLVIREYTVKQALPTRQGMAGPQEEYFKNAAGQNVQTGQSYPGGGKQVELLIDTRSQMVDPKTSDVLWKSYLNPTAQYRIGDRTVAAQPVVRPVP